MVFESHLLKKEHHGNATHYNYRNSTHTGACIPNHQNSYLDGKE